MSAPSNQQSFKLQVAKLLDLPCKAGFILACSCAALLVAITFQQVVARHLFAASSVALQELSWHLFAGCFLLGGAEAYERGCHVRVDVLQQKLPRGQRQLVEVLGILFLLWPMCWVMVSYGWQATLQARQVVGLAPEGLWQWLLQGEASPDAGGLRARWIVKSLVSLSGLLLWLKSLSLLLRGGHHD